MKPLECPEFFELERELIDEFMLSFQETVDELDGIVQKLDTRPDAVNSIIHELFRTMHSLKGNCRMVFLEPFVDVIHALEEIVSDMRQGTRQYAPPFGALFVTVVDHVVVQMGALSSQGFADGEQLTRLGDAVARVQAAPAGAEMPVLNEVLDSLSVNRPAPLVEEVSSIYRLGQDSDLDFFRSQAKQLDQLSVYRRDRTAKELELCLCINGHLGNPVDVKQLTAAVYMHDVGMALVPHTIFNKQSDLSREERQMLQLHVATGAQWLYRLKGWEEAAQMVLHHHEQVDGKGYPQGLTAEQIHLGAQILAITDTFMAVTTERVDRSYKKTLFSAITLINGDSGRKFDSHCVEAFNMAVRQLYISRQES